MLTKPDCGWSDFSLDGTSVYTLSYLDNIPFEWLDDAIHGLETLNPFCVKGFMEPGRFLCVVSFWNCHIICEDEDRDPLIPQNTIHEISHTSMLQFCQQLYDDISKNLDKWVYWYDYASESDFDTNKEELIKKLAQLKKLIAEKEEHFGENRGFL
jgi:hypothetical protein